jgi:glycerate kinase
LKILVSMDSFKGSCTSYEAGESIKKGLIGADPDATVINLPIADGGEGTVDAILCSRHGERVKCRVTGPMGNMVDAEYGVLANGTAVMEMSSASGLMLVKREELNPLVATTYGTGEMIRAALNAGCTSILIGIGGSATNDGGAGMAQALGVSLLDADGKELGFGGKELSRLAAIDVSQADPRLKKCKITIASDVANPLCGKNGASLVYGPQKGATPEMANLLDAALAHYAEVIRTCCGLDVATVPGSGAAGGLGAGLLAFCSAQFRSGIETVIDLIGLDEQLQDVDLVITGEGRIDIQTSYGKVPVGVAKAAKKKAGIPTIAIVGGIGKGAEAVYEQGIDAIFPIADGPIGLDESQERVLELMERAANSIMRVLVVSRNLKDKQLVIGVQNENISL